MSDAVDPQVAGAHLLEALPGSSPDPARSSEPPWLERIGNEISQVARNHDIEIDEPPSRLLERLRHQEGWPDTEITFRRSHRLAWLTPARIRQQAANDRAVVASLEEKGINYGQAETAATQLFEMTVRLFAIDPCLDTLDTLHDELRIWPTGRKDNPQTFQAQIDAALSRLALDLRLGGARRDFPASYARNLRRDLPRFFNEQKRRNEIEEQVFDSLVQKFQPLTPTSSLVPGKAARLFVEEAITLIGNVIEELNAQSRQLSHDSKELNARISNTHNVGLLEQRAARLDRAAHDVSTVWQKWFAKSATSNTRLIAELSRDERQNDAVDQFIAVTTSLGLANFCSPEEIDEMLELEFRQTDE